MIKLHSIKLFLLLVFLGLNKILLGQVFINELDSDSPGIDDQEFVEIRTLTPNTSLNGYCLVFYNGNSTSSTANQSYMTIDLSSLSTDINGIVTIGNVGVSPVPDKILTDNLIQNGEDAIALYLAPAANFPDGTLATTTNLVHALAYDTGDPDAVALMALLGITAPQMDENQNGAMATESIQRKNDGTFEVKAPTPGAMNDGTGFMYNGLKIFANTAHHIEGDTIQIKITTQHPVVSNTNFNIGLSQGNFNTSDYTGLINVSMNIGDSMFNTVITVTDDVVDEGDEVMKIKFGVLPAGLNRLNDNVEIRINDNDYQIDPWGPPTLPTYGIVTSTAPIGYYNSIHGLSGAALKQALQDIIADPTLVRAHNYGDIFTIITEADHHPKNGNQVWLMYVETPRAKLDLQTSGSGTGKWNREHIYPQSRGGYSNGTSDIPDGINIYLPTNANDLLAGHADAHHIRAEDATENSTRNNKDYGQDYDGPTGNQGSWKGDAARAVFYMCVRYNGLDVIAGNPDDTISFKLGDLDSLLLWNTNDPRDDFEMNRNNYIYTWQHNRNPFIDLPDLASYLWGANAGQPYDLGLAVGNQSVPEFKIYPNPAHDKLYLSGAFNEGEFEIFDMLGRLIKNEKVHSNHPIDLHLNPGLYQLKLKLDQRIIIKPILIN